MVKGKPLCLEGLAPPLTIVLGSSAVRSASDVILIPWNVR